MLRTAFGWNAFGYHVFDLALHTVNGLLLAGFAAAPAPGRQDDPRLDDLFQELKTSQTPMDAQLYEDAIWRVWLQTGDDDLDRLMREGNLAMTTGRTDVARARYDEVIRRAPDYAEGWNKRATLHYLLHNFEASIADVERTLELEPRHFGALSGLGQIRDALDQPAEALEAYERALSLHPFLLGARERIRQIQEYFRQQQI